MVRLHTLGLLDLSTSDGVAIRSVLWQPKRAALLVYLAVARPHGVRQRDELLPLFWPESDDASARHSLSQALYALRRSLGDDILETVGREGVGVRTDALACDAVAFDQAVDAGRWADALDAYEGPFLNGFHLPGAEGFEGWAEQERQRLRERAVTAAWNLAREQVVDGLVHEAERTGRRAMALDPTGEDSVRTFLEALATAGAAEAAGRFYSDWAAHLGGELDIEPSPSLAARVETLLAGAGGGRTEGPGWRVGEGADPGGGASDGVGASLASSRPAVYITEPPFQQPSSVRRKTYLLAALGAAVLIAGGVILANLVLGSQPSADAPDAVGMSGDKVRRLDLVLPDSAPLAFVGEAPLGIGRPALAISPMGDHIAFVAREGTTTRLYVRPLDQRDALPLEGTEAAYRPFFSPDSEWIGFFAGRYLKKVAVGGGRPITLGTVAEPFGAAWGGDGRILVADRQGMRLVWFPAEGGAPEPQDPPLAFRVTEPHLIEGGEWILHGARDGALSMSSLATGRRYALTSRGWVHREEARPTDLLYGTNPRILDNGHIVYVSGDGVLQVVPVRSDGLPSGAPISVLEDIRVEGAEGGAQFDVSHDGSFVYAPGQNMRYSRFVRVWHGTGARDTLPFPADKHGAFALSPDGGRILVVIHRTAGPAELWVLDRRSGTRSRMPTEGIVAPYPRWDSDGQAVIYGEYGPSGTIRDGVMIRQTVTGPVLRDTLATGAWFLEPSPDGRLWATSRDNEIVLFDSQRNGILSLRRGPHAFLDFSPDGEWLAYTDYITGDRSDVYLSHVDALDVSHRVTRAGGEEAVWAPDGRLVYRNGDRWEQVEVSTEEGVRIGAPQLVLQGPYLQVPGWSSDIFPDGRSQLLLVNSSERVTRNLVVVLNWEQELAFLGRADRP